MINNSFRLKLANLLKITRTFKLDDAFILTQDFDGWTNGFICDITPAYLEVMKARASLKHNSPKGMIRYVIDKELGPKVKTVIPVEEGEIVEDIEWKLEDNNVILTSKKLRAKVNPSYIKYFAEAYKVLWGSVNFKLYGELKPVGVFIANHLSGLIMPIREE